MTQTQTPTQAPFSESVMDHFLHPRGTGTLPAPSGEGWAGDVDTHRFMRLQVQVVDGHVCDARFATYGCAPAIAAGSWVCEWAVGRSIAEAHSLTADHLNAALGGLPPVRRFCADLAVDALKNALSNATAASTPPDTATHTLSTNAENTSGDTP